MKLEELIKVYQRKGHVIFEDDRKPYNLNYGVIRDMGGQWNDLFFLFWKYKGKWNLIQWMGTSDPGAYYLKNPLNVLGTAILPAGQHRGLFKRGLHKGAYKALVQARPVMVYRDADKDETPEINDRQVKDTGWHGINSHRAHQDFEVRTIGKYGGGCQVTLNPDEYDVVDRVWDKGFEYWGETLTYTILEVEDF